MKPALSLYNIPASRPFGRTLAEWVFERYDAETLPRLRLLLPNRRACRTLREAFLAISGGKPLLLPRIHPIGDWETDHVPPDLLSAEILHAIPPAIDENRRILLLTRLVIEFEKRRESPPQPGQALQLARQLARFLDEITRENIDIFTLPKLVPTAELALHWQQTVDFLGIISTHWPRLLQEEGVIDPVDRRNRILKAVAHTWNHTPPGYPVIAAGSTGTQPATAALLSTIARLPEGAVVLPGLDQHMPEAEWEMLEPSHPQHALKQLLEYIGAGRKEIDTLSLTLARKEREHCLRAVFQPAAATAGWLSAELPLSAGFSDIRLLTAESVADEARMIAVALRETLETPEKTAALVTPDRDLARQVVAQMQRFNVVIDDSAGTPLLDTPPGVYMRLLMEYALSYAAPVPLLALLRHPLTALRTETANCRKLAGILDLIYLRGVRPENGLTALCRESKTRHPELSALLTQLQSESTVFFDWLSGKKPIAAGDLLSEHIRLAQALAETADEPGETRLWSGDAGNQLATALAEMANQLAVLPPIAPHAYPAFFEMLLADKVFRPRYGRHPRLSILSPLEARLQSFDRVILGGLNEDMWPARPTPDPWMSRPMRASFGLPPLERTIGQSAHDVVQLIASAPEVLLTRARKCVGKPAVASRWLVRLETLLEGKQASLADCSTYEEAKAALDKPSAVAPLARPEPKPPLHARPRRLSATKVEQWQRDPYMVYASSILRLKKLEDLDKEPNQLEFGNVVHKALQLFSERHPKATLLDCGRDAFDSLLDRPAVAALWWPRFEALAAWFLQQDNKRRSDGRLIISEREGSLPLEANGHSITFTTRIDRLEIDNEGRATLADYKTGSPPENSAVKRGLAVQLPVEALIAAQGVCNPPLPRTMEVTALEYWRLSGSEENCEIKLLEDKKGLNAAVLIEQCQHILADIVRACGDPDYSFSAQTNIKLLPAYNDYEHLTRRKEWEEA